MKTMYICKCGKTFNDYDAASKCENSHLEISDRVYSWELRNPTPSTNSDFDFDFDFDLQTFTPDSILPEFVVLKAQNYDYNRDADCEPASLRNPAIAVDKNAHNRETHFAVYQLVKRQSIDKLDRIARAYEAKQYGWDSTTGEVFDEPTED